MGFGGVKEVRCFAVASYPLVKRLQRMGFGHVVNLIHPLPVRKPLHNHETVVMHHIRWQVLCLQTVGKVLNCALMRLDAIFNWPVSFQVSFGCEYFRLHDVHPSIGFKSI